MPQRFYEGALNAATYDLGVGRPRPGTQGDVAFYLDLVRQAGGRVLELASGTGRVTVPLAEAGCHVVGLERAANMLARAERKRTDLPEDVRSRLRFVRGDMTDFDLGEEFDAVIVAFRSFAFLLTPEAQRRCLASTFRHLRPGGAFAFQVFDPDLGILTAEEPLPEAHTGLDPATGNTVRVEVIERSRDLVDQVVHETWRFTELDPTGRELRSEEEELVLRWTYRYEMRHLLELAGFEVLAEHSDFDRSPPAYGKEQIWVARRPA